jgi:hypothetical protein
MTHALIRKWRRQPLGGKRYLFEQDKIPQEMQLCFTSYQDFIGNSEYLNGDKTFRTCYRSKFHLGLIPVPFQGDLSSADIFICLINPGLSSLDYLVEEDPSYREILERNLQQNLGKDSYPFFPLDPKWLWTSGGRWWTDLFRGVISKLRLEKKCSYEEATKIIAKRVAALELVPYHSANADNVAGLVEDLKSTRLIKDYVQTVICPQVCSGKALLIIASGNTLWDIDCGCENGNANIVRRPKKGPPKAQLSMNPGGSGTRISDRLLK